MRANQLSAIPYLAALFVGLYFFEMASFPFSIDEELAAVRTNAAIWVGQGRWGAYLIEAFVLPQPIIPFVPVAIFGAGGILAYILLLDAARADAGPLRPLDYLLFTLFIGYPTWYFIVEFYSNLAAVGIGLGCAGVAVWLSFASGTRQRVAVMLFLASCFGTFSIAIYQSFVQTLAAMGCAVLAIRMLESRQHRPWRMFARFAAVIVLSLVLYKVGDVLFRLLFPSPNAYYESLFRLDGLLANPLGVIALTAREVINAYGVTTAMFEGAMWAAAALVVLGLVACAKPLWRLDRPSGLLLALIAAAVLFLPFATNLVGGGRLPPRALVAVPIAVWFFAYLGTGAKSRLVAIASTAAAVLCLVQLLIVNNTYQAANHFATKQDFAVAVILNGRISSLPEFDSAKTYSLSVFGGRTSNSIYPLPWSSTVGGSFFAWDGGNSGRISQYLHVLGFPYFPGASPEQQDQVIADYQLMPVFPAAGSVAIKGDVILVKLGAHPNARNTQSMQRAGITAQ